jgi:hypothetical protein
VTDLILHPTPRFRDVVREQVRVVGLSIRREALVGAVVLGIVTIAIVIDIVRGSMATWFDSDEWFEVAIAAFLFPFAVWLREKRFGPAFLWTLPVDRRRLALAKVFAGWVWLMSALAVVVFWHRGLAVVARVTDAKTIPLIAFIGATAAYLFGSALVLGLRHPMRWLLGSVGVFVLLGMLNESLGRRHGFGISSPIEHAAAGWQTLPPLAQLAIATLLSVGAGLAALWAAASRHGEHRRQ